MFLSALEQQLNNGPYNVSMTENGALGYKTTGKALLDLNFQVSSLRKKSESEIISAFAPAWAENNELALKWLFYVRDVRGGLGERRTFRILFSYIVNSITMEQMEHLLPLVMEYGRGDDLCVLLDTNKGDMTATYLRKQLELDYAHAKQNKPFSLLAKWLPTGRRHKQHPENARYAQYLASRFGMNLYAYRRYLAGPKRQLNLVETQMTQNQWNEIDYSAVPSRANLIYNGAFLRHDETRRREFLGKANRGEVKMHASVLFPHDIVHRYCTNTPSSRGWVWSLTAGKYDESLEALWKNLDNVFQNFDKNMIVVADGSGSMFTRVSDGTVMAIEVANALAVYCAEHLTGEFKNRFITFSMKPQLINLGTGTLQDKLNVIAGYTEVADTNIEAVFQLILQTAVQNKLSQQDLPQQILILSDMEFNRAVYHPTARLFDSIKAQYAAYGYQLPQLIFWNLCGRTGTIPVTTNEFGVNLISGFSPNALQAVFTGKTDPFEALCDVLMSDRYRAVTLNV